MKGDAIPHILRSEGKGEMGRYVVLTNGLGYDDRIGF
jgi:hypothetical protein